jgi:hypothetical protein
MQDGLHQRGRRNSEDLPNPQEFDAWRGAVLAFDFGDVRGMHLGLYGDLLLREMGTKTGFFYEGREITGGRWVMSHANADSSPRGRVSRGI